MEYKNIAKHQLQGYVAHELSDHIHCNPAASDIRRLTSENNLLFTSTKSLLTSTSNIEFNLDLYVRTVIKLLT